MTTSVRLSPREIEVLQLRASGLRNTDIAERLVIGIKTVETHLRHVKRKSGGLTGFALGVWLARQG